MKRLNKSPPMSSPETRLSFGCLVLAKNVVAKRPKPEEGLNHFATKHLCSFDTAMTC